MELTEKTVQSIRVVGMRHIGPYPEIAKTWQKFSLWKKEQNLTGENNFPVSVYHDDPCQVPQDQLRSDAAVTVAAEYKNDSKDVSVFDLPAGRYITFVHKGPYEKIGEAWMKTWQCNSGKESRTQVADVF